MKAFKAVYAAYARVGIPRVAGSSTVQGWIVSGNNANLGMVASFPTMTGGAGGTVSYFGVGIAPSGATQMLFFGPVTPTISVVVNVTPKLDTSTVVSQASGDNMGNSAATSLMLLLFNNTAWAGFGDTNGLQPSQTTAGFLYLSLHTATLDETMNQSQGPEISYT